MKKATVRVGTIYRGVQVVRATHRKGVAMKHLMLAAGLFLWCSSAHGQYPCPARAASYPAVKQRNIYRQLYAERLRQLYAEQIYYASLSAQADRDWDRLKRKYKQPTEERALRAERSVGK